MKKKLAALGLIASAIVVQANPWWENPRLMGSVTFGGQHGDGGPYHIAVDAGYTYLAVPQSMAIDPVSLYTWKDAANGVFDNPVNVISNSFLNDAYHGVQPRGAAISTVLGKELVGAYGGPYTFSVPLESLESPVLDVNNAEEANVFVIENSLGLTLDNFFFSNDGNYLYSSAQGSANRNKVIKYKVGNLDQSGVQLRAVDGCVYDFGKRIRNATFATIDGRTLYYGLMDGTNGVMVLDVDSGEISTVIPCFASQATYGGIAIGGAATHTPHLYVFPCTADRATWDLTIYELDPTGRALAGDGNPRVFSRDEVKELTGFSVTGENGIDVVVSDDESVLFLGANSKIAAIRYIPEVAVYNVGNKADVELNQSGEILPGAEISGLLRNLQNHYRPFVYIDGKAVEVDQFGTFAGTAGATADVVVTYAWDNSWYMDPVFINKVVIQGATTYSPWAGLLDEQNGRYFAAISCNNFSGRESGLAQIDASKLLKSRSLDQQAVNWTMEPFESGDETFRDLAYSPEYNVVLSSGFSGHTNKVVAYPVGGSWTNGQDRYFVSNDLGRRLWPAAFSHDSRYFYAIHGTVGEEPTGSWVNDTVTPALGRFRSVSDSTGKLVSFTFVDDIVTNNLPHIGDYACYVGVVRTYYDSANNREIVYVAGQDGVMAVDLSTTPPTIVRNWFKNVGKWDETYPSLNIIGASRGTPHLVLNRSTTGLGVYPLREDLMTLASPEPIAAYKKTDEPFASLGLNGNAMAFCGFGALENEKGIFFNAPTGDNASNNLENRIRFSTLLIGSHLLKNAFPETWLILR